MTFEELKAAGFVELRRCSICGTPVGYRVHSKYAVAIFNGTCDCTPNLEPREDYGRPLTHEELASIPTTPQEK